MRHALIVGMLLAVGGLGTGVALVRMRRRQLEGEFARGERLASPDTQLDYELAQMQGAKALYYEAALATERRLLPRQKQVKASAA